MAEVEAAAFAHSLTGLSAPFAQLSGHEMHYHGDSQLEVLPPRAMAALVLVFIP